MAKIKNSHILISGGTGSFGNRVARDLENLSPASITIFSRDEKKQYEMYRKYPDYQYVIGDVRDFDSVNQAMRKMDIVFHAAALKQVPNCEKWPMQAILTNIYGSYNVFKAAVDNNVTQVISLSTDKAVKPVNAMGMTKALMEKLMTHFSQAGTDTKFACVRYGNVLGSRGSVLPLFKSQIKKGGPVTLTVPHMTRFLLTLKDAVNLIFFAFENAKNGEIIVKKSPASTVELLAKAAIEHYSANVEIQVCNLGTRAGEKIHEVLINEFEMRTVKDMGSFYGIPTLIKEEYTKHDLVSTESKEYTSNNTKQISDVDEMINILKTVDMDLEMDL